MRMNVTIVVRAPDRHSLERRRKHCVSTSRTEAQSWRRRDQAAVRLRGSAFASYGVGGQNYLKTSSKQAGTRGLDASFWFTAEEGVNKVARSRNGSEQGMGSKLVECSGPRELDNSVVPAATHCELGEQQTDDCQP
jgi:hypothetical protein